MSKQDRTYARTASDLERKYKFGETFAEAMGLATDAKNAAEEAKNAAESAQKTLAELDGFADQVTQDIASLQEQIDGNVTTWFEDYVPTVSNEPASKWTTTELKNQHLGDVFYVVDNEEYSGYMYRWVLTNGSYSWSLVEDSEAAKALELAAKAQDTADGKRRVFVVQPTPPYDVGDLWTDGADLKVCKTTKLTGSYSASDWMLATDYINSDMAGDIAQGKLDTQTQTDIFNKLTNNGAIKGLFMKDGQLYINASYLVTGVIKSENGKLVIDLSGENVPTFNTGISTNGLTVRADAADVENLVQIEAKNLDDDTYYVDGRIYSATGNLLMRIVENFTPGLGEPQGVTTLMYNQDKSLNMKTTVSKTNAGIDFQRNEVTIGSIYCSSDGSMNLYVNKINGKTVSWKDNGDGTFTLIGR